MSAQHKPSTRRAWLLLALLHLGGCAEHHPATDAGGPPRDHRPAGEEGARPDDLSSDLTADGTVPLVDRLLPLELQGGFDWADLAALASGEAVVSWQRISPGGISWMGTGTTDDFQALRPLVSLTEQPLTPNTMVQLLSAGGRVFALAAGLEAPGASLLLSSSADGGQSWSAAQRLDRLVTGGALASLTETTSALHLAYRAAPGELRYLRSVDDGVSWSAPRVLATSENIPRCPVIAAAPDGALLILAAIGTPSQVKVFRSSDDGLSWEAGSCLAPDQGVCPAGLSLDLRHDGQRFHALWYDLPRSSVQHGHSSDGFSWEATDLQTGDLLASWDVDAAGQAHLAYAGQDTRSGQSSVLYRRFDGLSWQAPQLLDPQGAGGPLGTFPQLALGGEQLHLVWRGADPSATSSAGARLLWVASTDGGQSFSSPLPVDQGAGHAINFVRLAAQPGHAVLLWDSDLDSEPRLHLRRLVP